MAAMLGFNTSFPFPARKTSLIKALLMCSAVTGILSGIDIISGSEYSFSIFYLLPITIAVFITWKKAGHRLLDHMRGRVGSL